jgi:STE24 endopeptidase
MLAAVDVESKMYNTYFFLMVGFYLLDFVYNQFLFYLDRSLWSSEMPAEAESVYDAEEYARQRAYEKDNDRFRIVYGYSEFLVVMTALILGGAGWLDNLLRQYIANEQLLLISFFAILNFTSLIFNLPFDYYDTFVIEEKYGFNNESPSLFLQDKLKSFAFSCLAWCVLGTGLMALYNITPAWFWLLAWIALSVLITIIEYFIPHWGDLLFNRLTPIEEGALRSALESFAEQESFPKDNIFLIDESRRTTDSNAYFAGFGKHRSIVLTDTLIDDLTTEEILAVLAHEIGHEKKKHYIYDLVIAVATMGFKLWFFSLIVKNPSLTWALGGAIPSIHLSLVGFLLLCIPFEDIFNIISNCLSRIQEYQADNFAVERGLADTLISGSIKMGAKSLENLTPHPLGVFLCDTHPTLLQTLNNIREHRKTL